MHCHRLEKIRKLACFFGKLIFVLLFSDDTLETQSARKGEKKEKEDGHTGISRRKLPEIPEYQEMNICWVYSVAEYKQPPGAGIQQ